MYKYLCCYILFLSSCVSVKTQNAMNIELTILPSSGGGKGYTIMAEDDTLKTMLRGIGAVNNKIVVTNIKDEKIRLLDDVQKDSLYMLLKEVKSDFRSNDDAFMLDTWIYVIAINKQEIARFNSLTILEATDNKQLENLKKLIKRLISLSPMNLDLHSFS